MIYYAYAVGALRRKRGRESFSEPDARKRLPTPFSVTFSTPSGNFGNLTAGLMVKRAGLPIRRFVAATNVNDVVPEYLATGRYAPRPSVRTLANAMDVGNPSNFDRLLWLYGGSLERMRADISGSRHDDEEVRATIKKVYAERGYLLDPHSAIAYLGIAGGAGEARDARGPRVFLATAHPAKFREIVEPIIGHAIAKPAPLVEALAARRDVRPMPASIEALRDVVAVGSR
jgi:threonine synthase